MCRKERAKTMRTKKMKRALCFALAAGVFLSTPLNSNLYTAYAEETSAKQDTGKQIFDGIYDEWKLDEQCTKGGEKLERVKDSLNFASGLQNGNGTTANANFPAVALNPHEFNFNEEGNFSFKFKFNSSNNKDFGVYIGYKDPGNGLYIGRNNFFYYYQIYKDGTGKSENIASVFALGNSPETTIDISWTNDKKVTVKLNGRMSAMNKTDCSAMSWDNNKIAIKAGTLGNSVTDVTLKEIKYTGQKPTIIQEYEVTGNVLDEDDNPISGADIFVDGEKQTEATDATGSFSLKLEKGKYSLRFEKDGYEIDERELDINDSPISNMTVKLENPNTTKLDTILSEDMDVTVDKTFPRVVKYLMKKENLEGKVFYGQPELIRTIKINGEDIRLKKADVTSEIDGDTINYILKVKKGTEIDAIIKAFLKVEKNTLAFEITEITNNLDDTANPIETIEIPNHGLISIKEGQNDIGFKGALMSSNTNISGDEDLKDIPDNYKGDFMYAFISADGMSAGLWSNSENDGRNKASNITAGGASNTRIWAESGVSENKKILSLSSAKWYYHRKVTDSHGREHVVSETDMPKTKIIITGDENADNVVDWQDGAIAFRSIMNNPFKSEEVPELVAQRIAMNFGGQAQNPFLTTLDNAKKVALHTDGLGQSVILKGYGNEGHDSGHPDYYDIGKRIGGAKDMNTLMEKGKDLGARFGIHINCGEMYPEAKAFNNDSVRKSRYGGLHYGWNWLDQGVGIDSVYDLATGNRKERFNKLKDLVGDNLDYIYVDIWGNLTGGNDDSWQTRKLSKEINEHGWRMATEWGPTNEYDSTFQHWATDVTYGGGKSDSRGENSVVMRFLRNHQKDAWVANYHRCGGAALAPLLGGYNMKDFEGWQGRNDYDAYIQNLYEHNLTTKFIQHFKVLKWEEGKPFYTYGNQYTPDKKITLKNDEGDVLVLERASDDNDSNDYYKRTITLNGKVIATGAEPERFTDNGNESYLLPWLWDAATGKRVNEADEKLYHFNNQAGKTTWELPESWKNLADVKIYKLTELGKKDEQTIAVVEGKITIIAEAKQPYVVYKGSKENLTVKWSEGMHLIDAGFNSGSLESWTKDGTGDSEIVKSQSGNPMMKLTGEVAMSQKLTDLTPDRQYAVLVGVDNRSDSKALMSITNGAKKLAENYTIRSIAKNYVQAYAHNTKSATVDGNSYFQHMYVFFRAPSSGEATLTLSKLAGEGEAYFDDVRVVESDAANTSFDENGEIVKFTQDFENNVQGLYPFVVGGIEYVQDNRIHLSELNAPYTQAGWDVKKMDDVLEGNWSVKINGLTGRNAIAFQTIPQNFRFEPGVKYHVSFKYQSGTEGTYAVVKGIGENINSEPEPLVMAMGENAIYETDIVGDESGQTWFGIYSTSKKANLQGTYGGVADFGGYQDFVLDDLVITRVDEVIQESELIALIERAKKELTKDKLSSTNNKRAQIAIAKAEVALKEDGKNQKAINTAYYNLDTLLKELAGSSTELDPQDASNDLPLEGMTATAGSEQTGYQSEGLAKYAIDNNESTIWHTYWYAPQSEGLSNKWIDIQLKEADTVTGVRFLQRSGSQNGRIAKAEIQVKKKGETNYKTVKTSDFNTSGWNIVTFTAEEDVMNVRVQPLSTTGGNADEVNRFASLAEIRILKKVKEEEIKPDKAALEELVTKAEETKKKKAATNNIVVLEEKIKEAKAILAKEDASWFDILLAEANLKKVLKDFNEGKYKNNTIIPPIIPSEPSKEDGKSESEVKKPSETIEVNDDKTAQGTANVDKPAKNLKKDKRILKALKEVKTGTKVLKALQRETSKQLDLAKQLKNYRKAAKKDKSFLVVKKNVNRAISFLEKNKITTTDSLLKKLANLNKQLKKLQALNKNAKNEAKIKKLQKEMANIKLVISSLESAKKFFEK